MLSDEEWSGFQTNIKAFLQIKAASDFWRREELVFSEVFRKEINKMISELPEKPIAEESILFNKMKNSQSKNPPA